MPANSPTPLPTPPVKIQRGAAPTAPALSLIHICCFDECLPEETNRRIVDHIADVNLCYSEHARRYLNAEMCIRDSCGGNPACIWNVARQNGAQKRHDRRHAAIIPQKAAFSKACLLYTSRCV